MGLVLNPLTGQFDITGSSGGGGGTVTSVNGQTGAVSLGLDDLNDTNIVTPADGDLLVFNGTEWVAQAGTPRFSQTFDATTNWGIPSGGRYTITVPQVTHLKSTEPNVSIFELITGNYVATGVDEI